MTIDRELAADAMEAVRWVLRPKRPLATWERAAEIVATLAQAFAAEDQAGVEAALYELELLSRRVQERMGEESEDVEVPQRIRDRANELVHTLAPEGTEQE